MDPIHLARETLGLFTPKLGNTVLRGHGGSLFRTTVRVTVVLCLVLLLDRAARAQDADSRPKVGFGVAMTGPGGLYAYAPGKWGMLHVNVVNRQEQPMELFSATYFDDEPTLQYGRKIWVPPRSRLQTWHPVKMPSKVGPDGRTVRFHSLVMEASGSQEVLIKTDSGQMQHDGMLPLTKDMNTGLIARLGDERSPDFEDTFDLISTCRTKQLLSRRVTSVTDRIFTPGEESLQALDQLVICDGRAMNDAAGMGAIRRWLHRGGQLWILLEQVDPTMLEMLLGDEFQCQVVDRVSLTKVRIEAGPAGTAPTVAETEYDRPVDMLRVMVSDVEVAATVNGWPAAFWKNCGEGRLLVTTLGPRGWMELRPPTPAAPPRRARPPGERRPTIEDLTPDEGPGKYQLNDPMGQLSGEFWKIPKPVILTPTALEPIAQEYVGYSIPSRWLIVGLLAGFSGLLAVAGFGLWQAGRLEWLGAVGPVLACLVSLALIGAGTRQRQAVPPTAASVQFVRAIPGTDDFVADGQVGLFSQESGKSTLGAHQSGLMMPDMAGLQGSIRRMIWTDMNQWSWINLPAVAASRNATFHTSGELPERVTATAMFGPDGLVGKLQTGKDQRASDALLATMNGRMGAEIKPDGTLTIRSNNVFSREQFLSADLLTDEQNRRRKVLQQLLTNPQRVDYPIEPQLMFWTTPWDLGFDFDPKARALGAALVTVPLKLQRPPTGTEVSIAAPFLSFRPITGPDGARPSGMYDPRTRDFAEKSWPSTTWLRFDVPHVLLPVQVQSGKLVIQVTGPIGKVEITGVREGKIESLKTWVDPVGTIELPITSGDWLPIDPSGGILLRITGGDPDRPELTRTETADGPKTNYWRFESVSLELKAKTIGVESKNEK